MSCPTLKSIIKYRRHPSITVIKETYKGRSFSFSATDKVDAISKIKKIIKRKAIHRDYILVETLKENVKFFAK